MTGMEFTKRTATCGELCARDAGKTVILNGWVHRIRNMGSLFFILLRDRYGITQITAGKDTVEEVKNILLSLKPEYCIAVKGKVVLRNEKDINKGMFTGEIEIEAEDAEIFTSSLSIPFQIDEVRQKDGSLVIPNEDLRLRYRYLDLRRSPMQNNIILRSKTVFAVREFLTELGFLEIETPTFIKSTPEGARDYLVPSRIHPGKFYSLPQSPQLYKQLLMVSGFDKYFQIARCYRDEDARGDRQPEFTQIDMEMSFTDREEVLKITEGMMNYVFKKTLNYNLPLEFDRLTWEDAFNFYGTDKPDLRFEMKIQDAEFMASLADFRAFKEALSAGKGAIKALNVKGQAEKYSRKMIEALEEKVKIYNAKGLAWMKVSKDGCFEGGISKFFAEHNTKILKELDAHPGDLLLFVADTNWKTACTAMGAVRSHLGKELKLYNPDDRFHFVWIIDFPYFAWNEEENKWETEHHMFTLPQKKYWSILESDPASVKGDLYDLVLNGYELASGSMRINDPALQERIFKIVGFDSKRAENAFGFLVNAFKYGAPPHGGIAPGLDRLVMLMCGSESIKEVIAFPKNTLAQSPMDDCPNFVDISQLKDLHIEIKKEKNDE